MLAKSNFRVAKISRAMRNVNEANILPHNKKLGILLGGIAATISSIIFSLSENFDYAIKNSQYVQNNPNIFFNIIITTLIIFWGYAIFPGMFGGYILARLMLIKKALFSSPGKGFGLGMIFGFIVGLVLCTIPIFLMRSEGNPDTVASVFMERIVKVLIITSFASGWTGWRLAKAMSVH